MKLHEVVAQMRQTARIHAETVLDEQFAIEDVHYLANSARTLLRYAKMVEDASKCQHCVGASPSEAVACYAHSQAAFESGSIGPSAAMIAAVKKHLSREKRRKR